MPGRKKTGRGKGEKAPFGSYRDFLKSRVSFLHRELSNKDETGQNWRTREASLREQEKNARKPPKRGLEAQSSQGVLGYDMMFESGLCHIGDGLWSRTVQVSELNYQAASREKQIDLFGRYAQLLNTLGHDTPVQITLRSKSRVRDPLEGSYLGHAGDGMDVYRDEMNGLLRKRTSSRDAGLARDKYFTLTQAAPSKAEAAAALSRSVASLRMHLSRLGCETSDLTGVQRLRLLSEELRPGEIFSFEYDSLITSSLTTKDAVAPDCMVFEPSCFRLAAGSLASVMYLRDLPSQMSDALLQDLLDLPFDVTVSLHLMPMDHNEALELVKKKIAYMDAQTMDEQRKAVRSGYDASMIPHELEYSRAEARELLSSMEKDDQRLFSFTCLVCVGAPDKDALETRTRAVQDAARKNNCTFSKILYDQENALNSVLPLGRLTIPVSRTLPTSAAAVFVPFTAKDLFDVTGNYFGVNALTKNAVLFDRRLLKSRNMIVLGVPGTGKSFAVKRDMFFNFFRDPGCEIIVLDPESEYAGVVSALGGQVVRIAPGTPTHVNAMDISEGYDDAGSPVDLKISFLLSFFEMINGHELSPGQIAVVDRAARIAYRSYYAARNSPPPTLKNLHAILRAQEEDEARSLALVLEVYVEGFLSIFSHQTNVDISNRVVCYDLKGLTGTLKSTGMLVLLDQIWNRVGANRAAGRKTWIYIDEIQLLLEHPESTKYFTALNSRGRKWGAGVTSVTQNAQNFFANTEARTIFSNAGSLLLFGQAQTDVEDLRNVLRLDYEQLSHVSGATAPGQGMLVIDETHIPFFDDMTECAAMYSVMTSKPEEYTYQERR